MDLHTVASTEVGGDRPPEIPLPPVRIVVAIDPQRVEPDGALLYSWRVTSTAVGADAGSPPQVTEGMRAEVAAIEHLSGTANVTSRGLARDVSIDPGSAADAGATGQMVEQVRQTLRDLAAPLPDEEVGRDARWEKLSQLATKDARITQTETFALVELGKDTGTLSDVLAQTAPPQPLLTPNAPEGVQARVESMLASGDARVHFDLSSLVPQSKFEGTTTMVVSGHSAGERARRMTMIMRIGIAIAGSKQ